MTSQLRKKLTIQLSQLHTYADLKLRGLVDPPSLLEVIQVALLTTHGQIMCFAILTECSVRVTRQNAYYGSGQGNRRGMGKRKKNKFSMQHFSLTQTIVSSDAFVQLTRACTAASVATVRYRQMGEAFIAFIPS